MQRRTGLRLLGLRGMREQIGVVFTLVTLIPLLASAYLVTRYVFPSAAARGDALAVIASTIVLCGLGWLVLIGLAREVRRIAARAYEVAAAKAATESALRGGRNADEIQGLDMALQGIDETLRSQMRLLNEKANQVRFLMKSVEIANEELSSLHRMKSEIISLATHEFRNPLQTILETVALFEEGVLGDLGEEQRRFVSHIGISARSLERIVGQMLMLAHLGEAGKRPPRQAQPSGPILEEAVEQSRPLAKWRGCRVRILGAPNGAAVAGDREDLVIALRSALGSLIRRVRPEGCVEAFLGHDDDFVRFSFSAGPVEMPVNDLQRFVASASADDSRIQDWSGLGELELPLAKELVHLQGGSVAARNEGDRVTLSVVLPAAACIPGSGARLPVPCGSSRS